MRISILGAPGSGKTTQSQLLAKSLVEIDAATGSVQDISQEIMSKLQ